MAPALERDDAARERGPPRPRPTLEHVLLAVGIDPGIPRQPNDRDRARQNNDAEQDYRQHNELPTTVSITFDFRYSFIMTQRSARGWPATDLTWVTFRENPWYTT
jgi:hypothetical protein